MINKLLPELWLRHGQATVLQSYASSSTGAIVYIGMRIPVQDNRFRFQKGMLTVTGRLAVLLELLCLALMY